MVDGSTPWNAAFGNALQSAINTAYVTCSFTQPVLGVYTPQSLYKDSAGNIRGVVDHNGYLTGFGVRQIIEGWTFAPASSPSLWATTVGAGASAVVQDPNVNYNAPFLQIVPATAGGITSYGLVTTNRLLIANASLQSVVLEFEMGLNAAAAGVASNTSWIAGFNPGTDPFGADRSFIYLYKPYNATAYRLNTNTGSVTSSATTGTAPSSNPNGVPVDRFKLEIQGTSSPVGAYQVQLWINESLVTTVVSANLPGAVTERMIFGSANEGGAPSGSPAMTIGPVRLTWNYLLAPPAI